MDNEPDITRNRHGGNPESEKAHEVAELTAPAARALIVNMATERGETGLCSFELERYMCAHSCSARCSELLRDGVLVRTKMERKTPRGCIAKVLVLAKFWKFGMGRVLYPNKPKKAKTNGKEKKNGGTGGLFN